MPPSPQPAHSTATVTSVVAGGLRHTSPRCAVLHDWSYAHMPGEGTSVGSPEWVEMTWGLDPGVWPTIARQGGLQLEQVGVREVFAGRGEVPGRCPECAVTVEPALTDVSGDPVEFDDIGRHVLLLPVPGWLGTITCGDVLARMLAPFGPSFPILPRSKHRPQDPGPFNLYVHEVPGPYASWLTPMLDAAAGDGHEGADTLLAPSPDGWVHARDGAALAAAVDWHSVWGGHVRAEDAASAALHLHTGMSAGPASSGPSTGSADGGQAPRSPAAAAAHGRRAEGAEQRTKQPAHSKVTVTSVVVDGLRHISPICQVLRRWSHAHMPEGEFTPVGPPEGRLVGDGVDPGVWPTIARQGGLELEQVGVRQVFAGPLDAGWSGRCPHCSLTVPGLVDGRGDPVEFDDIGRHVLLLPRPSVLGTVTTGDVLGDMLAPFGPSFPLPTMRPVRPELEPPTTGGLLVHEIPGPYATWLTQLIADSWMSDHVDPSAFLTKAPFGWVHARHGATLVERVGRSRVFDHPDFHEPAADLVRSAMEAAE